MTITFKDLNIGAKFEFDHAGLPICHGLESGPWIKTSSRGYRKDTSPFTADALERMDHFTYSHATMKCQVGSTRVAVIPL